ncbi:MAG: FapA family protein [Phycisphaerales bacterium]|nr:FapA family protein [Phycisphaerales bacterium]
MERPASISIQISPDSAEAVATFPIGPVDAEAVRAAAAKAGVDLNPEVRATIESLAAAHATDAPASAVIARATPPRHGEDGRIEWAENMNPRAARDEGAKTDHYTGARYVRVALGATIATLVPPTEGTPGRDVRGQTISPTRGKPAVLRAGDGVMLGTESRLVAKRAGIVILQDDEIRVSDTLEINGGVDFAVGHIDFEGHVHIAKGIGPGFRVRARGDIRVGDLVEPCDILCGGSLDCRSGIAGHGRGTISVARSARVGHMEQVKGVVREDLIVDREIIDCNLIVGRDLNSPSATVLGGSIEVTGSVRIATLGSERSPVTVLCVGDAPLLRGARLEAKNAVVKFQTQLDTLTEQRRMIQLNPKPSAADRERMCELEYELNAAEKGHAEASARLADLDARFNAQAKVDIHIGKMIHPGVRIKIGDRTASFTKPVRGPLAICWNEQHQLVIVPSGGTPQELSRVARVERFAPAAAA